MLSTHTERKESIAIARLRRDRSTTISSSSSCHSQVVQKKQATGFWFDDGRLPAESELKEV